ncbi:MAG: hypothetical protein HY098_00750 [Nitrospinae bacterium]|nr:hypothetical protein [Nitrospinota bacterium]
MLYSRFWGWKSAGFRRLATSLFFVGGIFILASAPVSNAAETASKHKEHMSQNYTLNIDPRMTATAGKEAYAEVMSFFDEAELAIEARDLDKLMTLYSESYVNGLRKKADIAAAWKRLFTDFSGLAMTHNMHLSLYDAKANLVIMTCSGILVGVPTGEKESIALDYWLNNDHVLVKENGKLKIVGTIGKEQKRLWFDKPMHPLF